MMRRGFTLMELLVSVVLIALITLFMYGAIASSKQTGRTLSRHSDVEQNRTMLYALFYRDLIEAMSVEALPTQNRRFTVVQLQTRNTLYDIAAPYVTWYVHAQTHDLIRLESARPIPLPVSYEQKVFIHADRFATQAEDFNLYTATDDNATAAGKSAASSAASESLSSEEERQQKEAAKRTKDARPGRMLLYLNTKQIPHLLLDIAI